MLPPSSSPSGITTTTAPSRIPPGQRLESIGQPIHVAQRRETCRSRWVLSSWSVRAMTSPWFRPCRRTHADDELLQRHHYGVIQGSRRRADDTHEPRPRSLSATTHVSADPVVLVGVWGGLRCPRQERESPTSMPRSGIPPPSAVRARLARNHSPSAPESSDCRLSVGDSSRWHVPARAEVCNVCVSPNASEHIQVAGRCRYNHEGRRYRLVRQR